MASFHVHVPGLGRGIDFVVELVRPGSDNLLQIVVSEFAVIECVVARVDRIHLVGRRPLHHHSAGRLVAWILLPDGNVGAVGNAGLDRPLIVNFRRCENSFLAIVIEAVKERVTGHEIVRRELRFDVRLGDDASDADVHPLEYVWDVEIKINHRHIEA